MNRRRKIVIALGAGVLAAPLALFAQQQGKIWRVGFLWGGSRSASLDSGSSEAFLQGMRELGYAEGRNFTLESRFADGKYERLAEFAKELVLLDVNVIVTAGAAATRAVQQATSSIPIVFAVVNDPISTGFAQSLARPGGHLTGLSRNTVDISPKHVELLRTIVPKLSYLAVLVNPSNPAHSVVLKAIQSAAQRVGIKVSPVEARTPEELVRSFALMKQARAQAAVVGLDQFFINHEQEIAQLALKHQLPTIYSIRDDVQAGGLMSYGSPWTEFYRRSATYVDKILKGAKPGELPIEQPTKFELVINRKTAKALGLAIPRELLLRADEVIE